MALGGGTWLTQNKVLPGTYVNFTSVAKTSAALSNRGYAAAPFVLSWGPEGEVFAVTSGDFKKNSKVIFGYACDHPKMLPLREFFLHATTVYCYRLGTGAVRASCALAEAKYPGARGNDLTVKVTANVDNTDMWDVGTYLDGICVDTQTVSKAADLMANDFVIFKSGSTLEATAGTPLTGGSDIAEITGDTHQAFLDAVEAYAFNVLCCPVADAATVQLYVAYTKRLRDELGANFQLVAWQPDADYEGVIGAWNTSTHATIENVGEHAIVYWAAGAQAGADINKSLTNLAYDGELTVDVGYTQADLQDAIKAGKFMLHNVNGTARVLEDVNTLVTLSDAKGAAFQSNQTIRVCDQLANDVAVVFSNRYMGKVPNDEAGRASLWNDVVKMLRELEGIRAIEDFNEDIVTCTQGDSKKAVVINMAGLCVVSAMEQLYMSVIIQ